VRIIGIDPVDIDARRHDVGDAAVANVEDALDNLLLDLIEKTPLLARRDEQFQLFGRFRSCAWAQAAEPQQKIARPLSVAIAGRSKSPLGIFARPLLQPQPTSGKSGSAAHLLIPFPTAVLSPALQTGSSLDAKVAVELYAAIGGLMCLSWLLVFHVLSINPRLLETHVELTFFPQERHRALLGFAFYVLAGMAGWLYSPTLALAIFVALPVFYGITSEGLIETQTGLLRRLDDRRQHRPVTPGLRTRPAGLRQQVRKD